MAYEEFKVVSVGMSASELELFNSMKPGVRKNLVEEYFRIRDLFKQDPTAHKSAWDRIQGMMLAHDGD